jgi:hypothetical protein
MRGVFGDTPPNPATRDPEQPNARPNHSEYEQQDQQTELQRVMPVDEPIIHAAERGRRRI